MQDGTGDFADPFLLDAVAVEIAVIIIFVAAVKAVTVGLRADDDDVVELFLERWSVCFGGEERGYDLVGCLVRIVIVVVFFRIGVVVIVAENFILLGIRFRWATEAFGQLSEKCGSHGLKFEYLRFDFMKME